jgi:putative sporulation protein YyaC
MAALERVHYEANRASSRIKKALWAQAREAAMAGRPLTIVGVGSAEVCGDALGPYVAAKIADHAKRNGAYVYGTLKYPVHAGNIAASVQTLDAMEDDPFVIAVDAACANGNPIGTLSVHNDSLRPGAGVGKSLPSIGEVSIMGGTIWKGATAYDMHFVAFSRIIDMGDVIVSALKSLITDYAKVQRKAASA